CLPQPSPTHTSTLSLHDALPILPANVGSWRRNPNVVALIPSKSSTNTDRAERRSEQLSARRRNRSWKYGDPHIPILLYLGAGISDRKSTRLNSSHVAISYAVFCL